MPKSIRSSARSFGNRLASLGKPPPSAPKRCLTQSSNRRTMRDEDIPLPDLQSSLWPMQPHEEQDQSLITSDHEVIPSIETDSFEVSEGEMVLWSPKKKWWIFAMAKVRIQMWSPPLWRT